MRSPRWNSALPLWGMVLLGLAGPAAAAEPSKDAAPLAQDPSKPSRPFSLVFESMTYSAVFQHNAGTDWFVEMTPPGQTVDTWRTLLVLHWFPADTGAPEDATRRLAALADRADARTHALMTENARSNEALVYFHARSKERRLHEGVVFKFGRTVGARGLVAVQFSVRFDANETPATADRMLEEAVETTKGFDLGQITLANGQWGASPPNQAAFVPTSASAERPR